MKPDRFRQLLAHRESAAASGSAEPAPSSVDEGLDRLDARFKLARETHDVDERRPQIMRHDIGEALDLLVRPGEVLGALPHPLLEARVEDWMSRCA